MNEGKITFWKYIFYNSELYFTESVLFVEKFKKFPFSDVYGTWPIFFKVFFYSEYFWKHFVTNASVHHLNRHKMFLFYMTYFNYLCIVVWNMQECTLANLPCQHSPVASAHSSPLFHFWAEKTLLKITQSGIFHFTILSRSAYFSLYFGYMFPQLLYVHRVININWIATNIHSNNWEHGAGMDHMTSAPTTQPVTQVGHTVFLL
jgi:hypothetical protein